MDITAAFCVGAFAGALCACVVVLYAVGILSTKGHI